MEKQAKNIAFENYLKLVNKFPEKSWNWYAITYNPNINIDFIKKYSNKDWDQSHITYYSKITLKDIEKHPNMPWDWDAMSCLEEEILACNEYIIELKKLKLNQIEEELMQKNWHLSRFEKWCLPIDEIE